MITLLPAIYTGSSKALDLIWQSDLAESTKKAYVGILAKYLQTGGQLNDRQALIRFAGTLTDSRKPIFRAALRCWSRQMIDKMPELVPPEMVTPEGMAKVDWMIWQLDSLASSIKVKRRRGQRAHTWLTDDQIAQLYESCGDDLRGLRDKVLLGLMLNCGLRRNETIAAKWGHIVAQPFEDELCAVLNVIDGKGGQDRAIPLPQALSALLDQWAEQIGERRGYVVRAIRGDHIKARATKAIPTYVVQVHGAAIGLPNLAPHDLRRTAAQAWWNESHDLMLVCELLGHKSIETTKRYLFVDQARKMAAVRAVKWGHTSTSLQ